MEKRNYTQVQTLLGNERLTTGPGGTIPICHADVLRIVNG